MAEAVAKTSELTTDRYTGTPAKARSLGVDVTRGIALITMLAANVFDPFDSNGKPSLAVMTVMGRSATLFAMVAGISLAFMTGGRHPVRGRRRQAVAAGIAVRALLIGAIGLAIAPLGQDELEVILPFYGLCFLLAIPLIGLRPRTLACIAAGLVVVSPLVILGASSLGLVDPAFSASELTFTAPFVNPVGFVLQLFVTGYFPAVVYMIYICAGLAIGRLDLSSTKVAARLLVGGSVMAVTAWVVSSVILFRLGGLQHLQGAVGDDNLQTTATNAILWNPDRVASWWWLAIRAHHSGTPIDALHTLGSAMAVLGAALLVTKLPAAQRVLWPLGVAGSMTLTIYSAHVPLLGSHLLADYPLALFALLVVVAVSFSVAWRRWRGQGPLERLVATTSGRAREATARWLARRDRDDVPTATAPVTK